MKKIVHEIRNQPEHVRELATILCTVAVVAIVGLVWFHSFQKDIYALLNPSQQTDAQDKFFAVESKSLFSSILGTFGDTKAQLLSVFKGSGNGTTVKNSSASVSPTPQASPHPLP